MNEDRLTAGLARLRVEAPQHLATRVVTELGLEEVTDQYVAVDGPDGTLFVAFNDEGISHVRGAATVDGSGGYEAAFVAEMGRGVVPAQRPPAGLKRALSTGSSRHLRFDLSGLSDFARAVLLKTLEIPAGQVRPYGWIAREMGKPGATRAVGTALNRNPVPVLIPCHRVVRSDGAVGEYAFGTAMKESLLEHEGVSLQTLAEYEAEGVRFTGSDTTSIFCYPTCHHARRTTAAHLVAFHSEAEARAAGFRPCRVCRPAAVAS